MLAMSEKGDRVAPRIYCLPATEAPIVAVLRRGDPAVLFEEDLSLLEPDPTPPPAWAGRW